MLYNIFVNSDTTRPQRVLEENGQSYWFTDAESMDEDIKQSKFLEYGEYNGYIYGTHLDSIREIIQQVIIFINKLQDLII